MFCAPLLLLHPLAPLLLDYTACVRFIAAHIPAGLHKHTHTMSLLKKNITTLLSFAEA